MTRRKKIWLICIGIGVLVLAGAAGTWHHTDKKVGSEAVIAVVTGTEQANRDFLNGIRMALDIVNSRGGLLGRPVRHEIYQEPDGVRVRGELHTAHDSMDLASRIVAQPNTVAVIGHNSSDTAIPSGAIYDHARVPFMATHATNTSLSRGGMRHIYGLLPNDEVATHFMARYAMTSGMSNFVILGDLTEYGKESTDYFASAVATQGATISYMGLVEPAIRDIETLILFLLDNNAFSIKTVDAIFIVGWPPDAVGYFIKLARQVGILKPILGTDGILATDVSAIAGPAMKDVMGISLYDVNSLNPEAIDFIEGYKKRYDQLPSSSAAVGFDAVKLIADIYQRAGSFNAEDFANTARLMRYDRPFRGAMGSLSFGSDGMIANADIFVVRHDGTAFSTDARYRYSEHMFEDTSKTIRAISPSFRQIGGHPE
ncbi:MAG: ABC transporter substrate-binding protein [Alphaproteobacteria bacterium]|nr:ABC transporter substrate-binding protein [Alphaproteobacteria bacterium]MBU0797208.1 ABC transporter substrate-binding protein [Alphaproteobacteria bacterium]MBU0887121.1 ABC transporter substrate-binding protein [Alphaproteobacteria bacterium]MBU1814371.1 ABC transporter substrate-binding protein [Alphaproteobacteria bacterium]MBU2090295.1 ABC transporter substrate-binding protein [Alphaproteobacteria bacterium]